ncbi:hypothetical protein SK128_006527 [Halocaridina rubra]|uniref:Uncharacterized protein n=1 Tax=Halocaridina rubra TaxID=373956 RepID=A0AAN8XAS8_HALRR
MAAGGKPQLVVKIVLKVLEMVCVIAAIALMMSNDLVFSVTRAGIFFGDGTLMMTIVVTPLLLFFSFAGKKDGALFQAVVNLVFGVFLIAAGSLGIQNWNDLNVISTPIVKKALAMGSMCIVGGFFYLADCLHSLYVFKTAGD